MALSTGTRRISPDGALALWKTYKETGDIEARNRLVMTYLPLVRHIVFRKLRELPARCDVDDFVSSGIEALIAAIDRYDPAHGTSIEQFAWTRIQGAVLDDLRRQDWAPRSLRRREREISHARDRFVALHGRRPGERELADSLAISVAELRSHEDEVALADVTSLNTPAGGEEDTNVERLDTIEATDTRLDPEEAAAIKHAKESFRRAFAELPARERKVAVLLYAQNLTLQEIGRQLEVSESRVCQIHAKLKRSLRAQLADDTALFAAVR